MENKDRYINVLMTKTEKELLVSASNYTSLTLSSFIRSSAIEKANSILKKKEVTEDVK